MPGLIDSHAHPVVGDFTPRQRTIDFIESSLHGGVTTMISAGEPHVPGRPKDIVGLKALAIADRPRVCRRSGPAASRSAPARRSSSTGLVEADFAEMAAGGVRLIGEIGLGSVKSGADAAPMVAWARAHGMVSTFHTGGPSLPGSGRDRRRRGPRGEPAHRRPHQRRHDVAVRGATSTGSSPRDTGIALELVHCGNGRTALVRARARPRRPARSAASSSATTRRPGPASCRSGILRLMAHLASLGGVAPETVVALATGNTARVHGLDTGVIAPGKAADLCIVDAPGRVGRDDGARRRWRTATSRASRWCSSMATPLIGRSRNTAPAGADGGGRQGPRGRRRRALMRFGLRLPSFALGRGHGEPRRDGRLPAPRGGPRLRERAAHRPPARRAAGLPNDLARAGLAAVRAGRRHPDDPARDAGAGAAVPRPGRVRQGVGDARRAVRRPLDPRASASAGTRASSRRCASRSGSAAAG